MPIISETLIVKQYSISKRPNTSHYTIAYIDKTSHKVESRHLQSAHRVQEWLSNKVGRISAANQRAVEAL